MGREQGWGGPRVGRGARRGQGVVERARWGWREELGGGRVGEGGRGVGWGEDLGGGGSRVGMGRGKELGGGREETEQGGDGERGWGGEQLDAYNGSAVDVPTWTC